MKSSACASVSRPMRLRDMVGQDHAVALLLRSVESRRVAHAYLFDGPAGVGKRTAGVALGLGLACPVAPGQGCAQCDVCRRILAGHHPDVRTVAPDGTQILIDQAQDIVRLASTRPHEAPARVIVIDDADRMNASAANCLLKTLEEPFPGTHLVLVTAAPDRLLPTIRSRTQRVRFLPVPPATLVTLATGRGLDARSAETAAALAGGSIARLWELLGTDTEEGLWGAVAVLRRAAAERTMAPVFDAAAGLGDKESKDTLPQVLALLGRFYRDALVTAVGAPDLVLLRERGRELDPLAAAARRHPGCRPLHRALAAVVEAETGLAANVNATLVLERMLIALRPCEPPSSDEALSR